MCYKENNGYIIFMYSEMTVNDAVQQVVLCSIILTELFARQQIDLFS